MDGVRKLGGWLTILVRCWDLVKHAGWAGPIALLSGSAWVAAVQFFADVPWWIWSPLAVVVAAGLFNLLYTFRLLWAIRGRKSFDLQAFAKQCKDYYAEWFGFASSRLPNYAAITASEDPHESLKEWKDAQKKRLEAETAILERFGPRMLVILHQLKELKIPTPNWHSFGDMAPPSLYIGQVGELLSQGLLDQARKLDPMSTFSARVR